MVAELQTRTTESLITLRDEIDRILSARSWKAGDKAYWVSANGVMQGTVVIINNNGSLCIKKKGEIQYSTVLPPTRAFKSYEAATRAARK